MLTSTTTRRLSICKDSKLIQKISSVDLIRILNEDRILLARTNIQARVMKIPNTEMPITHRHRLLPNTDHVKSELLEMVSELDILAVVGEIPNFSIDRLFSLIHAFTGEIPTISSMINESKTDDMDIPIVLMDTESNPVSKR